MIVQAFVRGAIVIVMAALLATLLRHRSAALRHHVWATAIVVQLAVLAFMPALPRLRLPVIPSVLAQIEAPGLTTEAAGIAADAGAESNPLTREAVATEPLVSSEGETAGGRSWRDYLFYLWMSGAALILARLLAGTISMLRISLNGERVEDPDWLVLVQRTARELGITRPVTMIWGDKVSVPITWGVLYPMILLPASARAWPIERRRFVLVHELAHVKRFDALTQLVAQLATAVFWFSPFVWVAEWRMRVERERACDDTVLQHGTDPTVYAEELLRMVRSLVRRRTPQPAFAALAMARKSEFEGRMLAILDPDRPRRVTGVTSGLVFALLSVLIAAPLAAVDPFAVRVVATSSAAGSLALPTVPLQGAAPIQDKAGGPVCDFKLGGTGTTAEVAEDDAWEIRLRRAQRCVLGEASGGVALSADERRILQVPRGGFVKLREITPQRDIQLTIENSSRGGLARSFTINGRKPDDDGSTERAWVARVLPELLTEGSLHVPQRVRRMLDANGLNGALREIAAIKSEAARLEHFKALATAAKWTDAELSRLKGVAGQSLNGRSQEALSRAMQRGRGRTLGPADLQLMDSILAGITTDYDLSQAMAAQLRGADRELLLLLLRHATRIGSDYDLRTFLMQAGPVMFASAGDVRRAWLATSTHIDNSYERSLALLYAIPQVKADPTLTSNLLDATTTMSGSEKAAVLAEMAKEGLINTEALRSAFLKQVNSLTSGADRRTVLQAF